ncbi:hypothetical protein [Streptomyces sp. NPDC003697]
MGVFARFFRRSKAAEGTSAVGERGGAVTGGAGTSAEASEAADEAGVASGAAGSSDAGDGTEESAESAKAARAAEEAGSASEADAVRGDGAVGGADPDADAVEIPRQQSAEDAAGHETGEGARR